jgi:hypothetical protein
MMLRRSGVLIALWAILATGGCAGGSEPSAAPASAVPSGSASPTPAVPSDPTPPGSAVPSGSASPAPGAAEAKTITGTVTAGVEPGCLLLAGDREAHLLVFDDESLRSQAKVGERLTVTGRAEPDTMTTCQQGIPFIVTAVRRAS